MEYLNKTQIPGFMWKCPNCGKEISGTSELQVNFNRQSHEIVCGSKRNQESKVEEGWLRNK